MSSCVRQPFEHPSKTSGLEHGETKFFPPARCKLPKGTWYRLCPPVQRSQCDPWVAPDIPYREVIIDSTTRRGYQGGCPCSVLQQMEPLVGGEKVTAELRTEKWAQQRPSWHVKADGRPPFFQDGNGGGPLCPGSLTSLI